MSVSEALFCLFVKAGTYTALAVAAVQTWEWIGKQIRRAAHKAKRGGE